MKNKGVLVVIIIIVVLLAGIFFIYNQMRKSESGSLQPCVWVYKTKGDYFDLHLVHLDTDRGKLLEVEHGVKTMYRLNDFYVAHLTGCYFPRHLAFVNISVSEFKAAEEAEKNKYWECWELMEPFAKNIIEEKCNETNFDKFDPEGYPPGLIGGITGEGEYIGSNAFSINYINKEGNKDFCGAILSSEEKDEYESLRENVHSCDRVTPRLEIFDNYVDVEYLLNNVVDDDPFTEFYLCDMDLDLNEIINNNELDTRCEKKK